MDFTELFCDVDDFCQKFEPLWYQRQMAQRQRHRLPHLGLPRFQTFLLHVVLAA